MKKVLVISILLVAGSTFGQLNKPIEGVSFSTTKKENFSGFIGENATAVFSLDYLYLSRKKQELNVRKFHKRDLELIESKNIYVPPEGDFYSEPTEAFYHDDRIYLFSTLFGEKGNPNLLELKIFNSNFVKISQGVVDTLEEDEIVFIQDSKEGDQFILGRYNKYSRLTEQQIALTHIDRYGVVLWRERIKSPLTLQNINIEEIRFSENSPIYILCNYAFELKNRNAVSGQDLLNNKYAIWAYDPNRNFLKEFELRIKGKWINGIRMGINGDRNLIVSGFMNESKNHSINGVFSLLIDPNLNVINSSFSKFDTDVRKKFVNAREINKVKELEDYVLNDIAIQSNDSYFLLGERYYKFVERNYDPRTNITSTTEHYNYNSIIVSYFDSLGNHVWTECVPKFQSSTNDYGYFASFSTMNIQDGIYLFFNDTEKNNEVGLMDYFGYKSLFNNRRAQISYVQIDQKGVKERGALIDATNDYILRAKQCHQISRETMYLMGETGRQARVFAVSLADN